MKFEVGEIAVVVKSKRPDLVEVGDEVEILAGS